MTCLYCVVCGDPTGGGKVCSRVCSDVRDAEAEEEYTRRAAAQERPFANVAHAARGWCAANGCAYVVAEIFPDWCSVFVRVGDIRGPELRGGAATVEGVLRALDNALEKHRLELAGASIAQQTRESSRLSTPNADQGLGGHLSAQFQAFERRSAFRLIRGGKS